MAFLRTMTVGAAALLLVGSGVLAVAASSSAPSISVYAPTDSTCQDKLLGSYPVQLDACVAPPSPLNTTWASYRVTLTDATTNQYVVSGWGSTPDCSGPAADVTIQGYGTQCQSYVRGPVWGGSFILHTPLVAPLTVRSYLNTCWCQSVAPTTPSVLYGIAPNECVHLEILGSSSRYLALNADQTFSYSFYDDAHCAQASSVFGNITGVMDKCITTANCAAMPILITKTQSQAQAPSRKHRHTPHRMLGEETLF